MNQGKLFEQILNPVNRHNPYPLYAQLRKTPISQQEDGTYVVSTYREIEALLYDPRISSNEYTRNTFLIHALTPTVQTMSILASAEAFTTVLEHP